MHPLYDSAKNKPAKWPAGRWAQLRIWLGMLFFDHGLARLIINRVTEVAPGFYRSSHPLPFQIRRAKRMGVRTVINLRGQGHSEGSYVLEKRACDQAGIRLLQFRMRSRDAPWPAEVLGFADLCKQIEYPVLMHCKSGSDRVGLASALYLMLREGQPVTEARRQLSLRFGHIRQAKTGILDLFLEHFARDQAEYGESLEQWASTRYDADAVRREFRANWWASFITDRILRRE